MDEYDETCIGNFDRADKALLEEIVKDIKTYDDIPREDYESIQFTNVFEVRDEALTIDYKYIPNMVSVHFLVDRIGMDGYVHQFHKKLKFRRQQRIDNGC